MSVILLFSYRVHLIIWVKSLSDPKRLAAEVHVQERSTVSAGALVPDII